MPRGDGQGPPGGGQRGGNKGQGRGQGQGRGYAGPGGTCICPSCGYRESHTRGVPCNRKKCPKCGAIMTR